MDVKVLVKRQRGPAGPRSRGDPPDGRARPLAMSAGSTNALVEEADHGPLAELRSTRGAAAPRRAASASRGMSTPLAMVSPSVPGIRGFTSSSAGRPAASRLHWTLATKVMPTASATARPNDDSSGSRTVRPPTDTPESTRARSRGTDATTRPLRVGEHVDRVLLARQELLDEQAGRALERRPVPPPSRLSTTPRDPLPVRGLTMTG